MNTKKMKMMIITVLAKIRKNRLILDSLRTLSKM